MPGEAEIVRAHVRLDVGAVAGFGFQMPAADIAEHFKAALLMNCLDISRLRIFECILLRLGRKVDQVLHGAEHRRHDIFIDALRADECIERTAVVREIKREVVIERRALGHYAGVSHVAERNVVAVESRARRQAVAHAVKAVFVDNQAELLMRIEIGIGMRVDG